MSFILDALKKSEAERRQGEIPNLQNDFASAVPRRRPVWPFLLTLALLLNGAVLCGWLFLRQEEPPLVVKASGEPGRILAARADHPEPAGTHLAPEPVSRVRKAETANPPAAVAPSTKSSARPAQPPAPAHAKSKPAMAEVAKPQAEPKAPVPVKMETPAAASEAAPSIREDGLTELPAKPEQIVRKVQTVKKAKAAEQADEKLSASAAPPKAESFPPVAELPSDVRSGLPDLNLQLHFFSPEPARRLVRLNGFNLREGERGGDGLSVVEITPDGIRLSCRGVRFFLPTARR